MRAASVLSSRSFHWVNGTARALRRAPGLSWGKVQAPATAEPKLIPNFFNPLEPNPNGAVSNIAGSAAGARCLEG
jgi:hypothetical protein